jgi:hypothetical protein
MAALLLVGAISGWVSLSVPCTVTRGCRLAGPVQCRPQDKEISAEDRIRYGNRTPEEIANMKKWGKILSQADTFDDEYLEKGGMGVGKSSRAPTDKPGNGEGAVIGLSIVIFAAMAFQLAQASPSL